MLGRTEFVSLLQPSALAHSVVSCKQAHGRFFTTHLQHYIAALRTLQALLEQGTYRAAETCRAEAAAAKQGKPAQVAIRRTIGTQRPVKFELTDRLPSDKERWSRVVALFCNGKAWQFKQYPNDLFKVRYSLVVSCI